ncbi:MAG: hypothetical protein RSD67_03885 [Oscillospiraceae bacterium]
MKTEIISFTTRGYELSKKLLGLIDGEVHINTGSKKTAEILNITYKNHNVWTKENFDLADNLIFIGATGIAIRSVAPFLKSKTTDPAVLVIDERGSFVIPILSGHIGGANKLAVMVSEKLNATPVLTTATDVNNVFSIDSWAVEQGLKVHNPYKIKDVSAKILEGETITIMSEIPINGDVPDGVKIIDFTDNDVSDVKIIANAVEKSSYLVLLYDDNTKSISF